MKRTLRTFSVFLSGLIAAQILGTIQVYISNHSLYRAVSAALEAGYFSVPNRLVLPTLLQFKTALIGGLFFTLSTGSAITLLSWATVWLWSRIFKRKRTVLLVISAAWLVLIATFSLSGFDLLVLLYFLIIPPVVFTLGAGPANTDLTASPGWIPNLPFIGLLGLVFAWLPVADSNIFINLRDYLLLANPISKTINDAYYRYTLYPAQVFKTLEQKTIKTIYLTPTGEKSRRNRLASRLIGLDYLPITEPESAELRVKISEPDLSFSHRGKEILKIPLQDFMIQPGEVMKNISDRTDRFKYFRIFTSIGVLIGYPIMIYALLYCLLFLAANLLLPPRQSAVLAALAVFLAGILLAIPLYKGKFGNINAEEMESALKSGIWQERVAGLRALAAAGKDPRAIIDTGTVQRSSHIPERYWFVSAMGNSPETKTPDLLPYLDDPGINVVCMAYSGLGKRGTHHLIEPLLERLENEERWYVQWYGYRTLRMIGWSQKDKLRIKN